MPITVTIPSIHSDPCTRARMLAEAKTRIITGTQESEFEYRTEQSTRRIRYTQANLTELENEIRAAEEACAAAQGQPFKRRRFAITAGSRRFP